MSYQNDTTNDPITCNEEASFMLEALDKATARFQYDVDQSQFAGLEKNEVMSELYALCDQLSHSIEEARDHFKEEYHLVEIKTELTHFLWVKGGTVSAAQSAAADHVFDHMDGSIYESDPIDMRVINVEHMETRSHDEWDDENNADVEI